MPILRRAWFGPAVWVSVAAALVLAILLDTTYLSATAAAKSDPTVFDPVSYVQQRFPKIQQTLADKATDLGTLAAAIDADLAAAGGKYGQDLGAGSYAFPVTFTGTVGTVDENFAIVTVQGVPAGDVVRIPVGAALNGSPVRDATGDMRFGDFNDQTDYQFVSDQIKAQIQKQVLAPANLAAASGTTVTVTGALASGGPEGSFIVQPVRIETSS